MKETLMKLNDLEVGPTIIKVRSFCSLKISFSLDDDLPKESSIIFRFRGGRNNKNDWYFLQADDPNHNGYVRLVLGKPLKLIPIIITGKELSIKYVICDEEGIPKNMRFNLEVRHTLAQSLVESNKPIEILIEHKGKDPILLDNIPRLNIIHADLDHITIICPSTVNVKEKFHALIRLEDEYKNLVEDSSGILKLNIIGSSGEPCFSREISFNEDSNGVLKVEDLVLSDPGQYQVECSCQGLKSKSNPITCSKKGLHDNLYWGYIHGHTLKSDGIRCLNEYFANLIKAGLDFGMSTEHDHGWETTDDDFEEIKEMVRKHSKDHEFISIFGYEWGTWYSGFGDICIYHMDDSIPILRSDVNKYNSTPKIIKNLKAHEGKVLMVSHHTALRPGYRNWEHLDDSLERLVEIYSTWGNQEYPHSKGNPIPPRYKFFGQGKYSRKRGAILEKKGKFVLDALKRGYKLGFTAGGDDHFGSYPSGQIDPDNGIYPPGIMAVWAPELTKKALWDALFNRKCYGTTGPRAIIEFHLEEHFMGDIINIRDYPRLGKERNLKIKIISPLTIKQLEIIRNGEVLLKREANSSQVTLEYADHVPFESVSLQHQTKKEQFVFYYLRIFLTENNMAWSSPIWVIQDD